MFAASERPKIVVAMVIKIARAKLRSRGGGGMNMPGGGIIGGIGCMPGGGIGPGRYPGGGGGGLNAPRGSIGPWPGGGCGIIVGSSFANGVRRHHHRSVAP